MFVYYLTVLSFLVSQSYGRVAPEYFKPCTSNKLDCLKPTIQDVISKMSKGIPELGLPSFDPLVQDNINVDLPGGMKIHFTHGRVTGLRNCIVDNVKMDRFNIDLMVHCNITVRGKYKAHGNILIVSINGDGDAKLKAKNLYINIKAKIEDVIRNGLTYSNIKKYTVKHSYGEDSKVFYLMTNLFKGNPMISDAVLSFLNANWRQVATEFGAPIVNSIAELVFSIIKKLFERVPRIELLGY